MNKRTILILLFAVFAFGCNNQANSNADNNPLAPPPFTANAKPQADAEVAVLETDFGVIKIELYSNVAPKMTARFKELTNEKFYDGTTFHRVNPNLGIIQGGDPNSKDDDPSNDGAGDSSKPNVQAEFSDIPFDVGIVGAARRGAGGGTTEKQSWDTANCQFFIMTRRQPAFDKRYTVFGKVIEGLNVAKIIAGAQTDAGGERPAEKILVKSVRIEKR